MDNRKHRNTMPERKEINGPVQCLEAVSKLQCREPRSETEPCGLVELRRQRLQLVKAEVATLCRQSNSQDEIIHSENSGELQRVLSSLWLSTDSCCVRKNLRPREKKKSLDSFPMNPNNSQSSYKAPAAVQRLHNTGALDGVV